MKPLPGWAARSSHATAANAPWEQTASAVKKEQRKLKQSKKTLVKTNEATTEDLREAIATKKKNNVVPLFLSDEQRRILNMVVEKRKSVFFTGSAGRPSTRMMTVMR